ncbi:hypothetical protein [Leifsonia sp.]|uniref:antitoxin VbhA family protein n=1 Tax=unclassified Leifsonia TaxID=2663824 RepID=UPI003704345C
MSVKTASTISAAERELRERVVADAAHSSEMEGLSSTAEFRADAAAFVEGSSTPTSWCVAPAPATALPEFVDPYLEPASGILRNNVGITDQRALDDAEADLVEARRVQMILRPVKATGDLRQLQAIHGQLFQDVYDWAGQLRTVDIRKGTDADAEFFMPVSRLESGEGSPSRSSRTRSSCAA